MPKDAPEGVLVGGALQTQGRVAPSLPSSRVTRKRLNFLVSAKLRLLRVRLNCRAVMLKQRRQDKKDIRTDEQEGRTLRIAASARSAEAFSVPSGLDNMGKRVHFACAHGAPVRQNLPSEIMRLYSTRGHSCQEHTHRGCLLYTSPSPRD